MGMPISPQSVKFEHGCDANHDCAVPVAHTAPIVAPISQDSSEQNMRDRLTTLLSRSVCSTQQKTRDLSSSACQAEGCSSRSWCSDDKCSVDGFIEVVDDDKVRHVSFAGAMGKLEVVGGSVGRLGGHKRIKCMK